MSPKRLFTGDRIFVMVCSLCTSIGLVVVAGLSFASYAFANSITIMVPWIARFEGYVDVDGSPAVTISGSWSAVMATTAIVASSLLLVALSSERFSHSRDRRV